MNIGTQIYAVLELSCVGFAALSFYSINRECLFYPKEKKEALCKRYPLFKNDKFTLSAWLFMSAFFVFRLFENVLPEFGVF